MKAVILMTRLPHPGATKTRMMPRLEPEQCADLHNCFLKDYEACFEHMDPEVELFVAYAPEHVTEEGLKLLPLVGERFIQQGDSLGQRMGHAIETVLEKGYGKAVLVGADIPHMQPTFYWQAFGALEDSDVVLGPTEDGGYCLIGMTAFHPQLFSDALKWGGASVLDVTCRAAGEQGLSVTLLESHRDIDTAEDLRALYRWLKSRKGTLEQFPEHTFRFVEEQLGKAVLDGYTAD